ncbi:hypothetical protein HX004_15770 [Myroides sp. 1354]|uniref:hypothetical protein n=1 Tax=unclassified Myroides TaxID=2642485 RepID=UPI0025786B2F|nr:MULTISPECIES: hypothetical protein [unclassified Myroides]MDM1046280.1 hypothetical protein [Myroides sp. R163-1]MDM1057217.1 hypothetical protein [Myroides sp. 1354]MDM1070454.1 hypothetical protein [Myroides sp. 1372]
MENRLMFDYTKRILENVSFDSDLFVKEFNKALLQMVPYDVDRLEQWVEKYVLDKPILHQKLSQIEMQEV